MGVRGSLICAYELVKSHGLSLFPATHLLDLVESPCGHLGWSGCQALGLHQVSCFLLLGIAFYHWPEVFGRLPAAPSGTSPVYHSGKKGLNLMFIPSKYLFHFITSLLISIRLIHMPCCGGMPTCPVLP